MSTTSYRTRDPNVKRAGRTNRLRSFLEERMGQREWEREERWQAIRLGTETTENSHWVIARLNEIAHLGMLDRKDGRGYLYQGWVGEGAAAEWMQAQIYEYQGDIAITFWPSDGRARRLLVTSQGRAYVEVWTNQGPSAIVHSGKYLRAWRKLALIRVTHSGNSLAREGH